MCGNLKIVLPITRNCTRAPFVCPFRLVDPPSCASGTTLLTLRRRTSLLTRGNHLPTAKSTNCANLLSTWPPLKGRCNKKLGNSKNNFVGMDRFVHSQSHRYPVRPFQTIGNGFIIDGFLLKSSRKWTESSSVNAARMAGVMLRISWTSNGVSSAMI